MIYILYVEDDAPSRQVLALIERIKPEFMKITFFSDSVDFENRLLNLKPQPDLILLDIHIKPYSGFEMLKIIRKHAACDATPVVALTASVMNEEIQTLRDAGFFGVIGKPINIEEFPILINRIMDGEQVWHVW
ncbi:response regulator [Anaerolineales bacterium]